MLSLSDITLCVVTDLFHELHMLSVDHCLKQAKFGDIKVFSDDDCGRDYVTKISKFPNSDEFARFVNYEIPKQIKTSHILFIQWDSWIVHPHRWSEEFLKYDYIGAPWWYHDEYNVGNGGFCLKSKRLMEFLTEHKDEFPIDWPEDHVLCREHRKKLPQFKWASSELAWHFSFEYTIRYPLNRTFGFHGLHNFPLVMSGEELDKRLEVISKEPLITERPEYKYIMEHK